MEAIIIGAASQQQQKLRSGSYSAPSPPPLPMPPPTTPPPQQQQHEQHKQQQHDQPQQQQQQRGGDSPPLDIPAQKIPSSSSGSSSGPVGKFLPLGAAPPIKRLFSQDSLKKGGAALKNLGAAGLGGTLGMLGSFKGERAHRELRARRPRPKSTPTCRFPCSRELRVSSRYSSHPAFMLLRPIPIPPNPTPPNPASPLQRSSWSPPRSA
jgi:hypothetical protein